MRDDLQEVMENAEKLRDSPEDFASLKIDGKEFILTTREQLLSIQKRFLDNEIKFLEEIEPAVDPERIGNEAYLVEDKIKELKMKLTKTSNSEECKTKEEIIEYVEELKKKGFSVPKESSEGGKRE